MAHSSSSADDDLDYECIIVGAGISGVCMAAQLLTSGITSFVVLEKSGDIGGTWSANRYPGCRCDVPSHLYCFSFLPSPDWTKSYAPRSEIHSYLRYCAKELGILSHFRFRTTVVSASWDGGAATWKLAILAGSATSAATLRCRFLIRATGPGLHIPRLPSVPGVSNHTFAGPSFHSSQWDPDLDLRDKVVAIIGTGASAVQIIPSIAPIAKQVVVCQRTPAWVVPVLDVSISPSVRRFFQRTPILLLLIRYFLYWIHEILFASQFFGVLLPYVGVVFGWASRRMLHRSVADPSIRAALTPTYPVGCKRVLLSNVFYETFARPNVRLLSGSLTEVRQRSIVVTQSGGGDADRKAVVEAAVDVIVYATGFDACAAPLEVVGRGGVRLSDAGHETLLGITKHGFPNFFMLLGPNTSLGHNSVVLMAEAQAKYIASCVEMRAAAPTGRRWRSMEVKLGAQDRFQMLLDAKFPSTVWRTGNCHSWYVHPVTGRNHIIWPGSTVEYFRRTESVSLADYHLTP